MSTVPWEQEESWSIEYRAYRGYQYSTLFRETYALILMGFHVYIIYITLLSISEDKSKINK